MDKETMKAAWQAKKERRARILEQRRNSRFAKKMQPVYRFMNRTSLIFSLFAGMCAELFYRSDFKTFPV